MTDITKFKSIAIKIDAYKIAEKTIQQWILGEGQYSIIKQSNCCYLFGKNKEGSL